jgi:hypothetical protein
MEAMLASLTQEQLRRLARLGAIARLEQLRQEEAYWAERRKAKAK